MTWTAGEYSPGCSKRSDFSPAQPWRAETRLVPSKAATPKLTLVSRFTVLGNDARTKLADFFSILLGQLLGTVKADAKLSRTMVGFAAAAGAGDLSFPVCGVVVKSAECFSALGDGRPGFVGSGDIGHEAAYGEGDMTALRGLSLRHTETTRLFCRGV